MFMAWKNVNNDLKKTCISAGSAYITNVVCFHVVAKYFVYWKSFYPNIKNLLFLNGDETMTGFVSLGGEVMQGE